MVAIPVIGMLPAKDAIAQSPPTIGMVIYGDAPAGSVAGQKITALVIKNGVSTNCGSGEVINDGGLKYVVRVRPASALAGCGEAGTSVRLFFGPTPSSASRFSTTSIPWAIGPKQHTVTLGNPLPVRGRMPNVASDGVAN